MNRAIASNNQAQVQLPTLAGSQEGSRLSNELRRFVDLVLRAGLFLTRNAPSRLITPVDGQVSALFWDANPNRVQLTANAVVQLPRISPRYVGVPLYVAKLTSTGVLTLRPTGRGLDRVTTSKINDFTEATFTNAQLIVLMHDGMHWYASYGT